MTMAGILRRRFASTIVPNDGVRPPKNRFEHSSTRCAPPSSASSASSSDPQQISRSTGGDYREGQRAQDKGQRAKVKGQRAGTFWRSSTLILMSRYIGLALLVLSIA